MNKRLAINIAKTISKTLKHGSCIAISVKDGVITNETQNLELPLSLLTNLKTPEDGFYLGKEATCGGICSIGIPSNNCINNGAYKHDKCSKYILDKLNENFIFPITVKDFSNLSQILV